LIIREDPDHVEVLGLTEFVAVERFQFATEHEVQKLGRGVGG
jgi:hypothetical protein